jgi:hypothetical protein
MHKSGMLQPRTRSRRVNNEVEKREGERVRPGKINASFCFENHDNERASSCGHARALIRPRRASIQMLPIRHGV